MPVNVLSLYKTPNKNMSVCLSVCPGYARGGGMFKLRFDRYIITWLVKLAEWTALQLNAAM